MSQSLFKVILLQNTLVLFVDNGLADRERQLKIRGNIRCENVRQAIKYKVKLSGRIYANIEVNCTMILSDKTTWVRSILLCLRWWCQIECQDDFQSMKAIRWTLCQRLISCQITCQQYSINVRSDKTLSRRSFCIFSMFFFQRLAARQIGKGAWRF